MPERDGYVALAHHFSACGVVAGPLDTGGWLPGSRSSTTTDRSLAHRGGPRVAGEHDAGLPGAVDLGYRYIETDVHLTADGVLVAFHDDRLDRVTDRVGVISELPYEEVAKARVDGSEPIPLFEDLLASFPDIRINVDPKNDNTVVPLARILVDRKAIDRVCIGAFSDRRIDRMRYLCGPDLCTSMGPRRVARLMAATQPAARRVSRPRFAAAAAQVPTRQGRLPLVTPAFIEGAHRAGVEVHVWTIDDPAEMATLWTWGRRHHDGPAPGVEGRAHRARQWR